MVDDLVYYKSWFWNDLQYTEECSHIIKTWFWLYSSVGNIYSLNNTDCKSIGFLWKIMFISAFLMILNQINEIKFFTEYGIVLRLYRQFTVAFRSYQGQEIWHSWMLLDSKNALTTFRPHFEIFLITQFKTWNLYMKYQS